MTADQTSAPSIRYRWTVLVMLTLVYTFNFIDRQILVILQEPIKADLGLSDAQLGLLTGFSFALVYVTAGIPIAWLADRSNRRNVVAASLAFWSFMTAISGLVQNFGQLLAARLGVGVGEAGGSPPSHSMISDYFPRVAAVPRCPFTAWVSILAFCSALPQAAGSLRTLAGAMRFS